MRIRGLLEQRRYADSLAASEALSAERPENRDALYMRAVSERYLNRLSAALTTLETLERLHPGFSRLYQERGHCYVAMRDAPRATKAFLDAVNINPALPASWARLERLYRMQGDTNNAAVAASHVSVLRQLAPEVVNATAFFSDGEWAAAEAIVRPFLMKHPNHVEAMRLLARIATARGVLDDAELLLSRVSELAPDYAIARYEYARVLLDRHKHGPALDQIGYLLNADPANRQFRTLFATISVGIGNHEQALDVYRSLLEDAPQSADLHLSIAHSLKTLGRREESVAAYRLAALHRPDFGDAYWSLANLKTHAFTDAELQAMRLAEESVQTAANDRYHLCFALGKALEDRQQYGESFTYYERGNALKNAETGYQPETVESNTRQQKQVCNAAFFAARKGVGSASREPIFIVGLPRAGSTLIEQILASHSRVEGTHELADIQRIAHALQGREAEAQHPCYPRALSELPSAAFAELGEKYLKDTSIYRTGSAHFIDKMPNNFRHLGLIHLMLPNAKIIDARREPMACCFSIWKQLFASGQEFSYNFEDIARYYLTYLDMMRHWDAVLPGKVLRVMHEDIVADLAGNVRRILDFCELQFEPNCLKFHENKRSVRTASSEQVRQPIYASGLDQWRNYESLLAPLAAALADAVRDYRR